MAEVDARLELYTIFYAPIKGVRLKFTCGALTAVFATLSRLASLDG